MKTNSQEYHVRMRSLLERERNVMERIKEAGATPGLTGVLKSIRNQMRMLKKGINGTFTI